MVSIARRRTAIALSLILAGVLLHWGAWQYDFVNYDDPDYVSANPVVLRGLHADGLGWAFGAHAANWHPLTWISHMLDVSLYGARAGGHHLSSLLLHGLNSALLFLAFSAASRRLGASFCLAGLYLLHPIQVESTLWIAERKDLLSASFALGSLWAYCVAWRAGRRALFWLSVGLLLMGLMSKPMLVSWPFVCLLVDRWPLERRDSLRTRVIEKWPMWLACFVVILLTIWAQRSGGSVSSLQQVPFGDRLINAVVSYGRYFEKYFWIGSDYVVSYPHPALVPAWGSWSVARIAFGLVVLAAVGLLAWRPRNEALRVGLLWWAGMLVPVIGLVQVGSQSLADRYMLLPSIGLGIALCYGLSFPSRTTGTVVALVVLPLLFVRSHRQGAVWADSETLFRHAVEHSSYNWLAWNNLGNALRDRDAQVEAMQAYDQALSIQPNSASAHYNRANALVDLRRLAEAEQGYRRSLELDPTQPGARNNLARVLLASRRPEDAVPVLRAALTVDPLDAVARLNFARLLHRMGRLSEASDVLDPPGLSPWEHAPEPIANGAGALRLQLAEAALDSL